MKRLSMVLLAMIVLGMGCTPCAKKSCPVAKNEAGDHERLYGVGYPALIRYQQDGIDYRKSFELMGMMGVRSWRAWMHSTMLLENPTTPKMENVKTMKDILAQAKKYDIEIVGMNHDWFGGGEDGVSMPPRDLAEGSAYRKVLADYEQTWETLARTFPEVERWEVGNEWNHDPFLHPMDYRESGMSSVFTWKQKAAITTDMLYAARQGIRRGNPKAIAIAAAPAPVYDTSSLQIFKQQGPPHEINVTIPGIAAFMILIYENIHGGHWPSTDPDDYFDAWAWHPYSWDREPGQWWVDYNQIARQVMVAYGDAEKEVYITEWGLTDEGDADKDALNGQWVAKVYRLIDEQMPYVRTLHYFRLYEDFRAATQRKSEDWGGTAEVHYGLFTEPENGWRPRAKAIAYQKMTGAKGNLSKFATQ